MNFGQRLRKLREDRGLTQTELANELTNENKKYSNRIISYYERGENKNPYPPKEILEDIAAFFGISINDLLRAPLNYSNKKHILTKKLILKTTEGKISWTELDYMEKEFDVISETEIIKFVANLLRENNYNEDWENFIDPTCSYRHESQNNTVYYAISLRNNNIDCIDDNIIIVTSKETKPIIIQDSEVYCSVAELLDEIMTYHPIEEDRTLDELIKSLDEE